MTTHAHTLERFAQWPSLLNEYLVSVSDNEYTLGEWDCCMLAAGCVEAITGFDPMEEFRGQYNDEASMSQVLQDIGAGTLFDTLKAKFGEPIPGAHGHRGDIGWYEGCCGIIIGRYALFLFEAGYGHIPVTRLDCAFRVGQA